MLGGEHDRRNAIVTIHPGAGGTESQDWAEMLLRMYLRWTERRGFKRDVMDLQPGDDAGIRGATVNVIGEYAYGLLLAEAGVHRLVRISPFDQAARRHTSFASVYVWPELPDDVDIVVEDKDLRIDTYRSSGAGGQHVNVTDSAVRITHLPTGIVVSCQNERSQHRNRDAAMKVLKARLFDLQHEGAAGEARAARRREEGHRLRQPDSRSTCLHPYQMMKDHRTKEQVGDVTRVLDGDIDGFIKAYLMKKAAGTLSARTADDDERGVSGPTRSRASGLLARDARRPAAVPGDERLGDRAGHRAVGGRPGRPVDADEHDVARRWRMSGRSGARRDPRLHDVHPDRQGRRRPRLARARAASSGRGPPRRRR